MTSIVPIIETDEFGNSEILLEEVVSESVTISVLKIGEESVRELSSGVDESTISSSISPIIVVESVVHVETIGLQFVSEPIVRRTHDERKNELVRGIRDG